MGDIKSQGRSFFILWIDKMGELEYIWGMENVHCIFNPDFKSLSVYRGEDLVGIVKMEDEDVKLTVYTNRNGIQEFTKNDLDIIWENWGEMLDQFQQKTS